MLYFDGVFQFSFQEEVCQYFSIYGRVDILYEPLSIDKQIEVNNLRLNSSLTANELLNIQRLGILLLELKELWSWDIMVDLRISFQRSVD